MAHRMHARLAAHLALIILSVSCNSLLPSLAWAATAFQESSGQVVIDAEHYNSKVPRNGQDWVLKTTTTGYAGSGYLEALPNTGISYNTGYVTSSPELVYNVQFATTGTYYVWVRGIGATGSDDSLHAGLDGTGPASADRISGIGTTWNWKRDTMDAAPATLVIASPGLHTIHLWMREDGLKVDKVLLRTSSSSTAPSGTGPAESPRVTVGPPPDTTPPTGSVTINGGSAATNNTAVTLSLSATDNSGTVTQMQCSSDGTTFTPAEPYKTSTSWTLPAGDGQKTVYVKFGDAAGNWSSPVSDAINLDTTPPQIAITSPSDGAVIPAPTP